MMWSRSSKVGSLRVAPLQLTSVPVFLHVPARACIDVLAFRDQLASKNTLFANRQLEPSRTNR